MRFLVTFISPKRSARTLQVAADHARAIGAEIIILKVVPDAHKVGVIAELISSDRPVQKATEQVAEAAHMLDQQGIAARGLVRVDEVVEGIIRAAIEWHVDAVYVGTFQDPDTLRLQNDPIARYLVEHCPANVLLVRQVDQTAQVKPVPPTEAPSAVPHASMRNPHTQPFRLKRFLIYSIAIIGLMLFGFMFANVHETVLTGGDQQTMSRVRGTLMDWHISGLWVINCPVAWFRVDNYNPYPIHEITLEYKTYTTDGKFLNEGTYEIEGTVGPNSSKNFIELYLGLVALESERLSVRLLSAKRK